MARTRPEITQAILQSRRWTPEEAATVLAAADASGRSLRAFAKQHGLVPQRLEWWRRALAGAHQPAAATFVEIMPPPTLDAGAGQFEVALANGRVVRVRAGFDAGELRRVLAAADEAAC